MIDSNIPISANMAATGLNHPVPQMMLMPTPQYGLHPLPAMSQPMPDMSNPYQPKAVYHQPASLCTVEVGQPANRPFPTCSTLTDSPGSTICPFCHENVVTKVTFHSGFLTWLLCLLLIFFGFIIGCCLIPFCVNCTKNVDHHCPQCNCHIFKYKRL